jgi:exopolysaccharide biosynthesis predicted pyruvyltransferase EpsI
MTSQNIPSGIFTMFTEKVDFLKTMKLVVTGFLHAPLLLSRWIKPPSIVTMDQAGTF